MDNLKSELKNLADQSVSHNGLFKRNLLKEHLQIFVLDYIYSHPRYSQLVFYGGSCLTHCFGLPRLSEDLDFVDLKKTIYVSQLATDLEAYFKNKSDLNLKVTVQKFRIYLKFPILFELGLAKKGESDQLFLKIEVFQDKLKNYKIETIPVFKTNRSILIKTFDFPTLMSTKIRAIINRKWEKTDKHGKTTLKAKGRDYFDLMWYLEKGVRPNLACLQNIHNSADLAEKLLGQVEKVDAKSIRADLESFVDNDKFTENLSKNIKDILKRNILKLK